jgi:hypothetical protein
VRGGGETEYEDVETVLSVEVQVQQQQLPQLPQLQVHYVLEYSRTLLQVEEVHDVTEHEEYDD